LFREGDIFAPSPVIIFFLFTGDHALRKSPVEMDRFPQLDDEELLRQIQEGNQEAFAALVDRHAKRFYSSAYRLLFSKNDAEDIVQQAFLNLWERRLLWNQSKGAKFTTWFYRVVVNLCLDHNRKKKPMPLPGNMEPIDKHDGLDILLDEKRKQAILDLFIKELPERQQLALTLCFYEGISNQEAAEIIGIKVKAMQSLIMRAKTTLKERLNHHSDSGSMFRRE
jgi:RNA polymerase sigma-70 factor (ECF subfamily)